jgi:plasmid stabilization system protein ParE
MKRYTLNINDGALDDIQEITDWYDDQSVGLGGRFQEQLDLRFDKLKNNPNSYRKRYADVHCMNVTKFPFLIHFTINEPNLAIVVFAVIHTSRNPKIWEQLRKQ